MSDVMAGVACGADSCTVISTGAGTAVEASGRPLLQIDIVSDAICLWCYVAKRQLESALPTLRRNFQVNVLWHPFQLNPGMPKEGLDRRAYRSAKFGSWEHSQRLDAQVAQAGRQVGLDFHHDRMERTPNTFDAHRLIWLAGERGVQDAIVELLFAAYFSEGRDIGDRAVLTDIAEHAGLPRGDVLAFLNGEEGIEPVREAEALAHAAGLSGVPAFVVNGLVLFSGALRSEVMIERILAVVAGPDSKPVSSARVAR